MSKHYHLRFDTKLVNDVCAISRIPCACVVCTTVLGKPWIYGIPLKKTRTLSPFNQLHLLARPRFIQQLDLHPIVTGINPLWRIL